MATASHYLYVVAGLLLVGAFAAHVAHTTLLAAGRSLAAALAPRPSPAFAGVVGGSFVAGLAAPSTDATGPRTVVAPFATGLAWAAAASLGMALLLRGIVVGPGALGQHVRVHRRVRLRDRGGLPRPRAPVPGALDRPGAPRRGAGPLPVQLDAAPGDRGARPGPPEPAAAHDPRRAGDGQLRHPRHELRRGPGLPRPGATPGRRPHGRPVRLASRPRDARCRRVPGCHRRLPRLRHDDRPRQLVGERRLVAATGAGTRRRRAPS